MQAVPGVSACPGDLNPATWMLEITASGPEKRTGIDFADVYRDSALAKWVE